MEEHNFQDWNVKKLQDFLKKRGVVISNLRKDLLVKFCLTASQIKLEIDPDKVEYDKSISVKAKLSSVDGQFFKTPVLLNDFSANLSILPKISIFDIYNYLLTFKQYDHEKLRDYKDMEGFQMKEDRYVLDIKVAKCETEDNVKNDKYVSIVSKVKPRTRDKDPVSKNESYCTWIITTSDPAYQGGSIYSAHCSCKGGADGSCRHVVATLFEVNEYMDDKSKFSVTSGENMWKRRSKPSILPVLVTELEASMEESDNNKPTEEQYNPVIGDIPDAKTFIMTLKRDYPEACVLDLMEKRPKLSENIPGLDIETPMEKAKSFFEYHKCADCNAECLSNFAHNMIYTSDEIMKIEKATRGQHKNVNWFNMRKGLLTASRFKEVIHCRDIHNTAKNLFKDSSLQEECLPQAIRFGRNNEAKARNMFHRNHKYEHKKVAMLEPGLIIKSTNCFLAASPDGLVKCTKCGDFLIEVKCFFKYKTFHPRNALLMSNVCKKNDDDELEVDKSHKYYYQIQGQMLCTGIHRCKLIAYTNKGIEAIDVDFDKTFCEVNEAKLSVFFNEAIYPYMKSSFHSNSE